MHVLFLGASLLAVLAFGCVLGSPGYLLAYLLNICGFRKARLPERLLWSVTLSSPLAILLSVYGGLLVGNRVVGLLFVFLTLIAAGLHWKVSEVTDFSFLKTPSVPRGLLIIVVTVSAYLLIAGAPVQLHGRLLEGVASGDWSVRVPLVASAERTGMPLVNPFYAVDGIVGPLRYYFYWYALGGVVGQAFSLPARAVLQAAAAWSAVLMFSTLFLLLRYLFQPAPEWGPLRWSTVCLGSVLAMPILGFDILQAVYLRFVSHAINPEIEWWRGGTGFSPSFHTFFLYAPHHTFGICAGLIGFVVLVLPRLPHASGYVFSRAQELVYASIAGLCFAALAGTSSYIAIFFALACCLVFVDCALRRDWWMLLCLLLCGIIAILGSWECVRVVLGAPGRTGGTRFIHFQLRGWLASANWLYTTFYQGGAVKPPRFLRFIFQLLTYTALEAAEVGVFVFVLIHRVRQDLLSKKQLLPEQRFQWALALAFFVCALCLTSQGIIPTNDLGFHAGFALRVIAVLWSAPWIATFWQDPSRRRQAFQGVWGRVAFAMILLGLGTQLWQIVGQRTLLLAPESLHRIDGPFPSPPDLPRQYEASYEAWQAIDKLLPTNAIILTNPDSSQRSLATLYSNRQLVAPEPNCMAAFGGSAAACASEMPHLRQLFSGSPSSSTELTQVNSGSSVDAACRENHATAILVSSDDAAWKRSDSWVWARTPIYSSDRARLYHCAPSPSPR